MAKKRTRRPEFPIEPAFGMPGYKAPPMTPERKATIERLERTFETPEEAEERKGVFVGGKKVERGGVEREDMPGVFETEERAEERLLTGALEEAEAAGVQRLEEGKGGVFIAGRQTEADRDAISRRNLQARGLSAEEVERGLSEIKGREAARDGGPVRESEVPPPVTEGPSGIPAQAEPLDEKQYAVQQAQEAQDVQQTVQAKQEVASVEKEAVHVEQASQTEVETIPKVTWTADPAQKQNVAARIARQLEKDSPPNPLTTAEEAQLARVEATGRDISKHPPLRRLAEQKEEYEAKRERIKANLLAQEQASHIVMLKTRKLALEIRKKEVDIRHTQVLTAKAAFELAGGKRALTQQNLQRVRDDKAYLKSQKKVDAESQTARGVTTSTAERNWGLRAGGIRGPALDTLIERGRTENVDDTATEGFIRAYSNADPDIHDKLSFVPVTQVVDVDAVKQEKMIKAMRETTGSLSARLNAAVEAGGFQENQRLGALTAAYNLARGMAAQTARQFRVEELKKMSEVNATPMMLHGAVTTPGQVLTELGRVGPGSAPHSSLVDIITDGKASRLDDQDVAGAMEVLKDTLQSGVGLDDAAFESWWAESPGVRAIESRMSAIVAEHNNGREISGRKATAELVQKSQRSSQAWTPRLREGLIPVAVKGTLGRVNPVYTGTEFPNDNKARKAAALYAQRELPDPATANRYMQGVEKMIKARTDRQEAEDEARAFERKEFWKVFVTDVLGGEEVELGGPTPL